MAGFPSWLIILCYLVLADSISSILLSLIFLYVYRNRPIVAMGQTRLLAVLCLGALIMTVGILFFVMAHSESRAREAIGIPRLCQLWMWLSYTGIMAVFGSLLCKMYRTARVVTLRRGQKVLARWAIAIFAGVMGTGLGFLVFVEARFPTLFDQGGLGLGDSTGLVCVSLSNPASTMAGFILSILPMVLSILVMWVACRVRSVDENIGDSHRILAAMRWFWLMLLFTGFLLFAFYVFDRPHLYLVEFLSEPLLAVCLLMAMIAHLIGPRMYYLWYEKVHGRLPDGVHEYGRGSVHVSVHATEENSPVAETLNATTIANTDIEEAGTDSSRQEQESE